MFVEGPDPATSQASARRIDGWRGDPASGNLWAGDDEIGINGPQAVSLDTFISLSGARYAAGGAVDLSLKHSEYTFTVTAVPEPATYGMLLAGLGVLGCLSRRRKHRI